MVNFEGPGGRIPNLPLRGSDGPDPLSPSTRANSVKLEFSRVIFTDAEEYEGKGAKRSNVCLNYKVEGYLDLEEDKDWPQFVRKIVEEFGGGKDSRPQIF